MIETEKLRAYVLSQEKVLTCDELENYYEIIEDARLMGKKIGELKSDLKLKVNSKRYAHLYCLTYCHELSGF